MIPGNFSGLQKQDPVSKLIFELSKLPGIGEKTATRLAYFILKQDEAYAQALSSALLSAKREVGLCSVCFTFTDSDPCRICADESRDRSVICVVERPSDMNSIEMSGTYRGAYHVLHGALSPLDGIGPDELKVRELIERARTGNGALLEVILAMNPSVEGDATSLYLTRLLRPLGMRVTQLAHGIPMGGQLEYTDRQTIGKAIENRMEMR
ncbi:MAG: recombination protein RecR [Cryobacterium sp.]|nr:recombination protein RecR [Oligoflexia bacterium]